MSQSNNNNPWQNWVKEQVPTSQDSIPPLRERSLPTMTALPLRSAPMTPNNNNTNRGGSYTVPSNDQLDLVLSNPIRCFCGKTAHRGFTLEYGPILECGTFDIDQIDNQKTKFICGFHVHETSWISFREQLKAGNTVYSEFSELRSCPQYNFSYCAMFRIRNQYKLDPPTKLPECFCRRPVLMRVSHKQSIQFTCKNAFIDGARKCSWVLNAKDVAFPRPKQRIHNHVAVEEYLLQKQQQKTKLVNKQKVNKEQHKYDLLAALSASTTPCSKPPLTCTVNYLAQGSEQDLTEKEKPILFKDLQEQQRALYSPTNMSSMIPTCVMSNQNKQHQKQKEQPMPISSSSSSSASSTITSPVVPSEEIQSIQLKQDEQLALIKQLNEMIGRQKDKMQRYCDTFQQERESNSIKIARFKNQLAELQTALYRSQNDKDEEIILRMNCQERLSNIEMEVVRLMNEKEKLTEEVLVHIEEKKSLGKEEELNKCRLCYTKNIEYCLIPCYHFAYCQLCAAKLTECAICRRSIEGTQKIYTC